MFGDPVMNTKGFDLDKLGHYGCFKNGLNFYKNEGDKLKHLGVSDFKNNYFIDDFSNIKGQ